MYDSMIPQRGKSFYTIMNYQAEKKKKKWVSFTSFKPKTYGLKFNLKPQLLFQLSN